uniref:Uncharacterized protein n=1 Tax=Panagrolaimus davidi TaxID=227884 RepID=A0A914QAQ1_9BILA
MAFLDLCQTSSSSRPNSLDDSVICLSHVHPSSSSVSSSSLHGQQTTDPPTQYEPPPKKNRRRTNKKSPMKKSPQKLSPAEGDESQTASNGVELIDGKVYATIKKAGKKGIPLKVEVDSSLLVEPKESCLKKPKNESWNGEKRFRWADWTKDKELTNIREFESDEKYSFRKSTKEKRFVDPYGD